MSHLDEIRRVVGGITQRNPAERAHWEAVAREAEGIMENGGQIGVTSSAPLRVREMDAVATLEPSMDAPDGLTRWALPDDFSSIRDIDDDSPCCSSIDSSYAQIRSLVARNEQPNERFLTTIGNDLVIYPVPRTVCISYYRRIPSLAVNDENFVSVKYRWLYEQCMAALMFRDARIDGDALTWFGTYSGNVMMANDTGSSRAVQSGSQIQRNIRAPG